MALETIPTSLTVIRTANAIAASTILTATDPWNLSHVRVSLTTDGTIGQRKAQILIKDPDGNTVRTISWNTTGATASTGTICETGLASATLNNVVYTQFGETIVPQGGTVEFFDQAAIAPATDTVQITVGYTAFITVNR